MMLKNLFIVGAVAVLPSKVSKPLSRHGSSSSNHMLSPKHSVSHELQFCYFVFNKCNVFSKEITM